MDKLYLVWYTRVSQLGVREQVDFTLLFPQNEEYLLNLLNI